MAASVLRRSDRPQASVLLVEDDGLVREVLAAAFDAAGFTVHHAATIETMARILRRRTIDVLVVDRHLPDGDGWTAAAELRKRATREAEPILIAMTAHLALSNAERALVAGCEAFIEKPCEPSAVVDEAVRLLRSRDPKTTTRRKRLRDT